MTLLQKLLVGLGFNGGVPIRYSENIVMVMYFLNTNGHNPAVTQSGHIVSVGTAPVRVHGKLADTRVRNPLHGRHDFDLSDPDSLAQIEEQLHKMMDKCESRSRKVFKKNAARQPYHR